MDELAKFTDVPPPTSNPIPVVAVNQAPVPSSKTVKARTVPLKPLAAAVIGGLLLGYGARLAFGCNIGAFFSGVASGSLHGWLWLAAALPGNWLGVRFRPLFDLPVEGRPG